MDIDGDGRADLVIGNGNGFLDGAIHVLYGDGDRQRIGVKSLRPRRSYGGFGSRIVTCDANGDGFSDVVAGAEFATVEGVEAGKVVVLYGAASGLSPRRLSVLSQSTPGVPGISESLDGFGASIGCGRLNADRFDDVAVGVPEESWRARPGHRESLGRLVIVPGGVNGVVPARSWALNQDSPGIPDRVEQFDEFAFSLLTADVTGDGKDELIVWGNEGDQLNGALFVIPGTKARIRAEGATVVYGRTEGLPRLGLALVAGNFDRRGPDDVIVSSGPNDGMGSVTMLRGTPMGLIATRSRTITRQSPGMPRLVDGWEAFGESLAVGDVDGDGDDDLLVSSSTEMVGGVGTAGRVFLIRGRTGGITTEGLQRFSADSPGVPGHSTGGGAFGQCVELIDLDGDGRTEAVMRHERIDGMFAVIPVVTILQATPSGLTGRGARRLEPADFGASPSGGGVFGCDLAG